MDDEVVVRTEKLRRLVSQVVWDQGLVNVLDVDVWPTEVCVALINTLDAELQRRHDQYCGGE